jgi:cyclophilin family peptidyl-prolyl cis-trans isomerase
MPSADKRARKKDNARAARAQREAVVKRKKQIRSAITVGVAILLFVGVIVLFSVTGNKKKAATTTTLAVGATASTTAATTTTAAPTATTDPKLDPTKTYTATITTNLGTIVVTLDTKTAPIGAAHFVKLADAGVYNGSRWHRIIKDFVIQGGAPGGDINKSYGHPVVAELPKGAYGLGDLAAAKTQNDPNGTYDDQFFIVTGSQGEALPDQYADFGKVTSGMDVVQKIDALKTDANDAPTTKATIDKVTITES